MLCSITTQLLRFYLATFTLDILQTLFYKWKQILLFDIESTNNH